MAAAALDMSLDDIIKSNKKPSGSRTGGRTGPGPNRRAKSRPRNRPASLRKVALETGTKLHISNLEYGVSEDDIKELFSEFGELKRYAVHYDRSGRSKGTAEVVFVRKENALVAVKRYNNVQLDGRPMKIEVVRKEIEKLTALAPVVNMSFKKASGNARSGRVQDDSMHKPRGGDRRQKGRGRGKGRSAPLSAEALDADLDKYHSGAMQIN